MKRFLLTLTGILLLAGCGGKTTLTYKMDFLIDDKDLNAKVTLASIRVIERRLARMESSPLDIAIDRKEDEVFLAVEVERMDIANKLNSEMTEPFTLDFMVQTKEGEEADLTVEGHGNFRSIGITQDDINWLNGGEDPLFRGKGRIGVGFNEQGAVRLKEEFEKHDGESMGIFVRKQLVAKIEANNEDFENIIVISQLPSSELAEVFADDVNVGKYVIFTPVQ